MKGKILIQIIFVLILPLWLVLEHCSKSIEVLIVVIIFSHKLPRTDVKSHEVNSRSSDVELRR